MSPEEVAGKQLKVGDAIAWFKPSEHFGVIVQVGPEYSVARMQNGSLFRYGNVFLLAAKKVVDALARYPGKAPSTESDPNKPPSHDEGGGS